MQLLKNVELGVWSAVFLGELCRPSLAEDRERDEGGGGSRVLTDAALKTSSKDLLYTAFHLLFAETV